MAELDKNLFSTSVESTPVEVDMLDFTYVEQCNDWKKLFSILEVLKSGKEGHYPELISVTEEKMLQSMPDKERRKYLALNSFASADEIAQVSAEMRKWQVSTSSLDAQLKAGEFKSTSDLASTNNISGAEVLSCLTKNQREKISEAGRKVKMEEMSGFQKERRAELERRKGNESFKASEYEASVKFYTISIALNTINDSVWANRAIAYIKLKYFELAEHDCDACLKINPTNVKAFARRGFAKFSQGKYKLAALDYLSAMKLDPSNEEYPKFLAKSKEMYASTEGKELILDNTDSSEEHKEQQPSVHPVRVHVTATTSVSSSTSQASSSGWSALDCPAGAALTDLLIPGEVLYLVNSGKLTPAANSSDEQESYIKIPVSIVEDEEDEEEEGGFVRIAIDEEDDSDAEAEEDEAAAAAAAAVALTEEERAAGVQSHMPAAEKATLLKDYGNKVMMAGNWATSIAAYSQSLSHQFSIATLNNRAQAKLSSQDYVGTISDTKEVLAVEPANVKALYRRAKAQYELQEYELCKTDLDQILKVDSVNGPALKMLVSVTDALTVKAKQAKKDAAETLKVDGNNAFQQGDVSKATELYSQALSLDPENISIYNNRALAYLKTGKWTETIQDCSKVIDDYHHTNNSSDDKQDAQRVAMVRKAHQRRAEARYQLTLSAASDAAASSSSSSSAAAAAQQRLSALSEALVDAEQALSLGAEAAGPISDLMALIKTSKEDTEETLKAAKTPKKTAAPASSPAPVSPVPAAKTPSSAVKTPSSASRSSAKSGEGSLVKMEVPSAPAKTLYEFERMWRGLSGRIDLELEYLKLFKTANFKKVFKAAISDDLLGSLFEALASPEADLNLCFKVLESLKQMNSFALTIRMLPKEALQNLAHIFQQMSTGLADTAATSQLKADYNI